MTPNRKHAYLLYFLIVLFQTWLWCTVFALAVLVLRADLLGILTRATVPCLTCSLPGQCASTISATCNRGGIGSTIGTAPTHFASCVVTYCSICSACEKPTPASCLVITSARA